VLCHIKLNGQTIDRTTWEKETKDVSFYEENDEPEEEKKHTPPRWAFDPSDVNWEPAKYIIIGLIILAIAFVLYRIFISSLNRKNANLKQPNVSIDYDSLDEHIHQVDLLSLLDKNIQDENYTVAVRLQFLEVLKKLSNFNYIKWQKQKTNGEYLSETRSLPFNNQFAQFARIYEYVWFGSKNIGKAEFLEIKPQYQSLMNSIGSDE